MAAEPRLTPELLASFGPLRAYQSGQRADSSAEPDRLVKTHCCFCGQQCGIQLKVKDNEVIGFEPWEDFPFNKGMLCPKGVRRYLQGSHHDRLTRAYFRDPSSPEGFRAAGYDEAIKRVASEITRIQAAYGNDAFAVLGGASMTTEKCYLMGKFARVCLKTRHIDYNGRLCMVSAAAGNKKAFGIDRAGNPMSDIPLAEVIWIGGANVAECAPITTSYIWQARENGARIINVDPRITPLARTCDLILPVKPGRDAALFAGVLHLMIEHDWLDHAFIRDHTVGFEKAAEAVKEWTPRKTAEVTGVSEAAIRQAAEWWGAAKTSYLMHARGMEQHARGVNNVLASINIAPGPDGWHTLEIICKADGLEVVADGTRKSFPDSRPVWGHLALQSLSRGIQLRDIKIRDLSPPLPPPPTRDFVITRTPRPLKELDSKSTVRAVAFAADAGTVIVGGDALTFFDAGTGAVVHQEKLPHPVTAPFSFTADRKTLALIHKDAAMIFDLPVRKIPLQPKSGFVFAAALSPNGKTIAYAADGTLIVHDRASGKSVTDKRHGRLMSLIYSPDGKHLIGVGGNTLKVLDARTLDLLASRPAGAIGLTDISRDGKRVAVTGMERGKPAFWVYGLPDMRLIHKEVGLPHVPVSAAFSPDGTYLALGTLKGRALLWDLIGMKEAASWDAGGAGPLGATFVAFSPDGKTLAAGSGTSVTLWRLAPAP